MHQRAIQEEQTRLQQGAHRRQHELLTGTASAINETTSTLPRYSSSRITHDNNDLLKSSQQISPAEDQSQHYSSIKKIPQQAAGTLFIFEFLKWHPQKLITR